MPIKAVKQKPMANMDFMRTYKQIGLNMNLITFDWQGGTSQYFFISMM